MKLSTRQKECLERIGYEWVGVDDMPKPRISMNTVYSLVEKGLIEIWWEGEIRNRKPYIRKVVSV